MLINPADYEAQQNLNVIVTVGDGLPSHNQSQSLSFAVNNLNDNGPVLTVNQLVTAINENLANITVATLSATDADGDPLTYSLSGADAAKFAIQGNNLVLVNPTDYEAQQNLTVIVTVGDGLAAHNQSQSLSFAVNNLNETPLASNDTYTTNEDTIMTIPGPGVLGNDSDVDGNLLSSILATGPTHGTLSLNANGSFVYTPDANYNGADSFTYMANDGSLNSNVATVNITVVPVNDAPTDITLSNTSIAENVQAGIIGTISITDPDSSGTYTYTLSDSRFEIVNNQLKLKNLITLDYEQQQNINLTITARDVAGGKVTKDFTLNVMNDNQSYDIPFFSSNPDSKNVVLINWNGGVFQGNTVTPFDTDGNSSSLSTSEQAIILKVMNGLAADYAPFDINFTTLAPQSLPAGYAYETIIIGNGTLSGNSLGLAFVNVFGNSTATGINGVLNTAVSGISTDQNLFTMALSHEIGHTMGLRHESNGTLEYSPGLNGWVPTMGAAPFQPTSRLNTWWYGSSLNTNNVQDDLAILNQKLDKVVDDHRDTFIDATALNASLINAAGVINFTSSFPFIAEHDMFALSVKQGAVTLNISNDVFFPSLAFSVTIYDSNGNIVATQTPDALVNYDNSITGQPSNIIQINTTFNDASFSFANLAADLYYVDITSNGVYGRLGNYTISGTTITSVEHAYGTQDKVYIGDDIHDISVLYTTNSDTIAATGIDNIIFGDDLIIATANQASFSSASSQYLWLVNNPTLWQASDSNGNDDILAAGNGNDIIYGQGGNDSLFGKGGDDLLYGGDGNDLLNGGVGNDTASYTRATTGVTANLTIPANNTGDAAGDSYFSIENLIGSNFNDTLRAAAAGSILDGRIGNDTLIGGAGADTFTGGDGTDAASYSIASTGVIANLTTPAINTGDAAGDTYNTIENLTGSNFNDTLTGNAGVNVLSGGLGDDILIGGAGADVLNGGAGTDTASYANAPIRVIASLVSPASNLGNSFGDTYTSIENVTGSDFNDTLTGNAGVNVLSGGLGDDILIGGAGADVLDGGAGTDAASYSTATSGLVVNLSNTALNTADAVGDSFTSIEKLIGSTFNDTLTAASIGTILDGGLGNDSLTGSTNIDTFVFIANSIFGTDNITNLNIIDFLNFTNITDFNANGSRLDEFTSMTDVIDNGAGSNVTMTVYNQGLSHISGNIMGVVILDGLGTFDLHLNSVNALINDNYQIIT